MNLLQLRQIFTPALLAAGALGTLAIPICGQVQTDTSVTHGPASKMVTVERGEVVSVVGNDLFVKMDDGQIRHFPNVPESTKVNVDGKELGIHDLKPGYASAAHDHDDDHSKDDHHGSERFRKSVARKSA